MAGWRVYYALQLVSLDGTDEDIRDEVTVDTTSFFERNCDEYLDVNRLYVVTKSDRVVLFPLDDDEEEAGDEDNYPVLWDSEWQRPTFEKAWEDAKSDVALHILGPDLWQEYADTPVNERTDFLRRKGAQRLSDIYASLAAKELPTDWGYKLDAAPDYYKLFLESVADKTEPFVQHFGDRTPYDYCAFYSSWMSCGGPNALLVMDVCS